MINAPRLRLKVSGRPLKGPPLNLQPQPSAKNAVAQQATHSPSPSHFDIQLFNFFNFSDDQISTFELLNFSGNKKSTFELFQLFQLFQCCNFNIWTFWTFERFQMLYLYFFNFWTFWRSCISTFELLNFWIAAASQLLKKLKKVEILLDLLKFLIYLKKKPTFGAHRARVCLFFASSAFAS